MKRNVGTIDRIARFVLGSTIIVAGVYFKSWWGVVGLIPLVTAAMGHCPPYALFGISTCRMKKGVGE